MSVSATVCQQAHRFFASSHADDVIVALDRSDLSLGFTRTTADRVQLAILLLSKGDMQRFRIVLSQATRDWRDTLVAASLAGDDWLDVLRREEIEIQH